MDRPFPAYRGDEPFIFVSYAHKNANLVYPELNWMKNQGFNVWYDEGDRVAVWRGPLTQLDSG